VLLWKKCKLKVWEWRFFLFGSHVCPDDARRLVYVICDRSDVLFEPRILGFSRLVEAFAIRGKFPSVIYTSQTTFLVAAPKETCVAVRASGFE
jgi:hypothetical protein